MLDIPPATPLDGFVFNRVVVLSVQPLWSQKIVRGEKTIELRRQAPRFLYGQPFIIYSTLPEGRLTAIGRFGSVLRMTLEDLWSSTAEMSCVNRKYFDLYFQGAQKGAGIEILNSIPLAEQPTLHELQLRNKFRAPQTWRYLSMEDALAMFHTARGKAQVQDLLNTPAPRESQEGI